MCEVVKVGFNVKWNGGGSFGQKNPPYFSTVRECLAGCGNYVVRIRWDGMGWDWYDGLYVCSRRGMNFETQCKIVYVKYSRQEDSTHPFNLLFEEQLCQNYLPNTIILIRHWHPTQYRPGRSIREKISTTRSPFSGSYWININQLADFHTQILIFISTRSMCSPAIPSDILRTISETPTKLPACCYKFSSSESSRAASLRILVLHHGITSVSIEKVPT